LTMENGSRKPVLIAAYGRGIAAALELVNIDAREVFDRAGVSLRSTSDPMQRMTNLEVSCIYREAVKATGDPYFGLFVGDNFHTANLHVLGFALLASSTLRDFCLRLRNYYHLASTNVEISLQESAQESTLIINTLNPDICWETHDTFITVIVRLMRTVYDPNFNPTRLELMRHQPVGGDKPFREYFKCEVLFDRPSMLICFDSAIIDKPLPGASKELAQMHDQTAMDYLQKLEHQDIPSRVRTIIVKDLSSGLVSKKQVADKLYMSTRNLELKLAVENTNFQKIVESTRRSLAEGYIEQSSIAITEIAYLLGFSDAANFTRAFKRWTGKSPLKFRKDLGLDR